MCSECRPPSWRSRRFSLSSTGRPAIRNTGWVGGCCTPAHLAPVLAPLSSLTEVSPGHGRWRGAANLAVKAGSAALQHLHVFQQPCEQGRKGGPYSQPGTAGQLICGEGRVLGQRELWRPWHPYPMAGSRSLGTALPGNGQSPRDRTFLGGWTWAGLRQALIKPRVLAQLSPPHLCKTIKPRRPLSTPDLNQKVER